MPRPQTQREGNMFTSLHVCWALFLLLRKRTFEPFPMSKWPITTAMLGKFKLLLLTACLVLPVHPPNTSPNPLAQRDRAVIFICLYSDRPSLLLIFSVQRLSLSPQRLTKTAPLAFWATAQTLATKNSGSFDKKKRGRTTMMMRERETGKVRGENGNEREKSWSVRRGEFAKCRCVVWSVNVLEMSQCSLPNTWNTSRHTQWNACVLWPTHMYQHHRPCGTTRFSVILKGNKKEPECKHP